MHPPDHLSMFSKKVSKYSLSRHTMVRRSRIWAENENPFPVTVGGTHETFHVQNFFMCS